MIRRRQAVALTQDREFRVSTSWRLAGLLVVSAAVIVSGVLVGIASATTDPTDWIVLIGLGALFVVAENRDRTFPDETGLSGSLVVALCAAAYFGTNGWLGGAFIACLAGGLYLPHLRSREWVKVVVNAACFGVSAAVATEAVTVIVSGGALAFASAATAAALVYWLANSVILATATAALRGGSIGERAITLIKADSVMVVFAIGGGLCGLVMAEVGVWTGFVALVAALVALDVFVISLPAGPAVFQSTWKVAAVRVVAGIATGVCAVTVTEACGGELGGAVVGGVAGVLLGLVALIGVAAVRLRVAGHRLDSIMLAGLAVAELPLVSIAAMAGVMGGTLGTASALLTASCLAILASVLSAWNRKRTAPRQLGGDDDVVLAAVIEAVLDGMPNTAEAR